ncbi:MAG: Potassium-transporting ATPase A chain [uncultured Quadrisphaera sp.]|uniref:Potassium-transporting ATPase potassium-binding subunit n=1 Tax=uncultured Quadrisphaera sp. TaxID=904978 RepID=A0A6J4NUF9_9ACTN|nr:MAG: Potassium-transporting ATPase A chain [uncultured Quadrisphaera sp.]
MGSTAAFLVALAVLLAALAACYAPLGDHMARTFTTRRHLGAERLLYRASGVDPDADQTWATYLRSLLAFSAVSVLVLYALLRLQDRLPLDRGLPPVTPSQAFETAASFVTNTNWQSYAGEATLGHAVQALGLAVQNFLSAAVGLAVAVALVRGFTRTRTDRIGNFWVDLVRGVTRVLLPLSLVAAVLLMAGGVVQNLSGDQTVTTLAGGAQTIVGGPVASQEAIKLAGTNGGGYSNANSAHPFENPNPATNFLEVLLLLLIPVALTRTFGTMVGDRRQGLAILGAMAVVFGISLAVTTGFEVAHPGTVPQAVGASLEGKEVRFGVEQSALFATATTTTSTGAVNSFHDSYTAIGGGMLILNMMFGEVTPGGVGAGLYGILVIATLAVFLAGLMVGRTPEYLQKKIGSREIELVALYVLATPTALLVGLAIAVSLPSFREGFTNSGAHGFSEALYAFTSASNNNGSAFAGITTATTFGNTALGLCMLVGRFLPIAFALALAGSLARQTPTPRSVGTLPTHSGLFVTLVVGVLVIVTGLTYFPALALGPLAEGLTTASGARS